MGYRSSGGRRDSKRYYTWLDRAQSDLHSARILMVHDGDWKNAAFHCQQAIEKALKGYLLFRTGRHFDGHNLTYLCRQAGRLDQGFMEYLDESAALNRFYIETRYPTDVPICFDPQRLRGVYRMAEDMFTSISRKIFKEANPTAEVDTVKAAE